MRRNELGDDPGVCRPAHPLRLGGQLAVSRIAAEAQAQLANPAKGAIVSALSPALVSKPVGVARQEMVATEREEELTGSGGSCPSDVDRLIALRGDRFEAQKKAPTDSRGRASQ